MNQPQSAEALHREIQDFQESCNPAKIKKYFRRPVIIVSTPRSGSTLLFETLSKSGGFWNIGGESHFVYGAFPRLRAENAQFDSGRLTARHADKNMAHALRTRFLYFMQNSQGKRLLGSPRKPEYIRFLEKTPRNALNIPFLEKIFPDARYIFLHRAPRQNISSIIDAWAIKNFITYPELPGWTGRPWHLLLPPGWRDLNGKPVADIAAFQWRMSNLIMMEDLKAIPRDRWMSIRYEGLVDDPAGEVQKICKFSGIEYDRQLQEVVSSQLALSSTTVTPPDPDKWKKHADEINRVMSGVEDVAAALLDLRQ